MDDDVQQLAAVTQFDAVVSFSSLDAKYSPPTQGNFSFPFSVVDDDQAGLSSTAPGILRLDEGSTIVIRYGCMPCVCASPFVCRVAQPACICVTY